MTPLLVGYKTNKHYMSILPLQQNRGAAPVMREKPKEIPPLLHFKTPEEIPEKIECPACHGVFTYPHRHVVNSPCKHRLSENLIHDLKLIENKRTAINQRFRAEKKQTSSKPATKAAPEEEKASAPKPADNLVPQTPAATKKADKPQSTSKTPPKEDPIEMLSRGQCPACKKPFKSPLQHINKSKCKNNVSPKVISEFQILQKKKKNNDRAERHASEKKADPVSFKEDQRKRKAESSENQKKADPIGFKDDQKTRKAASDANKRKTDPIGFKDDQKTRKAASRENQKKTESKMLQKVKKAINEDTGMEVKCCSCLELKSKSSSVSLRTLSKEMISKYCYQDELVRSRDGKFYVCLTCQTYIKADKEPPKSVKDIFGFLDFPAGER